MGRNLGLALWLFACGARTNISGLGADAGHEGHVEDALVDIRDACTPPAECAPVSCINAICTATVASLASPATFLDIVVDGDEIFWSTNVGNALEPGAIMRASVCGACPATLVSQAQGALLATDATFVYFVETTAPSSVSRVPKGGGAVEELAKFPGEQALALARNGNDLYLVLHAWGQSDRIAKLSTSGGAPVTLFSENDELMARGLAVDDQYVFWGGFDGHAALMRGLHDGTGAVALAQIDGPGAELIALDAAHVYWANVCGNVKRLPRDGAASQPEDVGQLSGCWSGVGHELAVDDANV